MKSSIFPLSDVPRERVIEFLVSRGVSPERAAWRYYDDRFSRGRNRAFVWFKDDMVKGFIGIIPCTLSTSAGDQPIAWTCNWFLRDPRGTPGMGILLLKRVQASYDMVGGVGGTADSKASVPNMNFRSVVNAAITFHRPLKLSGLLEKVENRLVQLPKLSRTLLGAIPLPRRKVDGAALIMVEDGVSPALEPLFDQPQHGACRVRYDHEYVDWQVGRCPGFRSLSLIAADNGVPAAGAVLWSQIDEPRYWRVVFRVLPGKEAILPAVIAAAMDCTARKGAALLSTVVSHLDGSAIASLRKRGFIAGQRQPLYITTEEGTAEQGFADLSYLDSDLASLL